MSKKAYWSESFEGDGLYIVAKHDDYDWNYSLVRVNNGELFSPFAPDKFHKLDELPNKE